MCSHHFRSTEPRPHGVAVPRAPAAAGFARWSRRAVAQAPGGTQGEGHEGHGMLRI